MFKRKPTSLIFTAIILLIFLVTPVLAAVGDTTLISVSFDGTQTNGQSYNPSISADGRYVTFISNATNLVAGDINGYEDVFQRDRLTGVVTLVTVASDGTQANNHTDNFTASTDGRYVVFHSWATNLGAVNTNGYGNIFVRDLVSQTTTLVSVTTDGVQGNGDFTYYLSISANGQYIAFSSSSSNFVAGDTNGFIDVFVRDLVNHTTRLISVAADGTQGNKDSGTASISANGRYVAFASSADNLVPGDTNGAYDVFVRDLQNNSITLASLSDSGNQVSGNSFVGNSLSQSISDDGRYVTFMSYGNNLTNENDNNAAPDVFVRDLTQGITTLVSVSKTGTAGNGLSESASITADGRFVTFESQSSDLIVGDTNGVYDCFVRDLVYQTTTRISLGSDGSQGNANSNFASISANQHYVVFESEATDFVMGDTNGNVDIFMSEIDIKPICYPLTLNYIGTGNPPTASPANSSGCISGQYIPRAIINLTAHPDANQTVISWRGTNNNSSSAVTNTATMPADPLTVTSIYVSLTAPVKNPDTGFAPNKVTSLPVQSSDKRYSDDGMSLEIPSLDLKQPIVGVPKTSDWDISWLGNSVGYLQGTAFPTWDGNSVLVGHVVDANGKPGPFANLGKLIWGQQVIINAWGHDYVYEVRSVDAWVKPTNTRLLNNHEETPWLTLITCHDYNKDTNSYSWRTIVRAVLIDIK